MSGGSDAFPNLLGSGSLGPLALRNRLAMCPMGVNLAGDDQVAWFEARARGGAGLIIVGSVSIAHPVGSFDERQAGIADDEQAADLRRTVDAVHGHGAAIAAQLVHGGTQAMLDMSAGRPLLVPSKKRPAPQDALSGMLTPDEMAGAMKPFTAPGAGMTVQVAGDDDLTDVIERFAAAARRAVAIGFDGIELHAGHGYLLHSFLSPYTNQRDDDWGGDATRRATLLVEVVRAVRAVVPPGFPVWARIGADERHREPAQHYGDAVVAMGLAVDAGLDALHVTAYAEPMVATGITDGHTPHAPGALLPYAARVKADLGVPVVAMGRLTPEAAEDALAAGMADVIAMGRPLIADPDLPRKLAAGRRDQVRPCAYQYRCISAIFTNDAVRCTVNADAGHEAEAPAPPADPDRFVVVAGAGPAGLECARRLAERGVRVEVWEAGAVAGGRLRLAERVDPDLLGLADWLVGAAIDAGAAIRLSTAASAEAARAAGATDLVWAVGRPWAGLDEVERWLASAPDGPASLTVLGAGKAAVSVALLAARGGAAVALDTGGADVLAPELGLPGRFRLVAEARATGVVEGGAVPGPVLDVRGGDAAPAPAPLDGLRLHVIGDAAGTAGIGDGIRAAADLAARL